MKTVSVPVRSEGKVVATIQVQQAETLKEAIKLVGNEENVVKHVNRQFKTDKANDARRGLSVPGQVKRLVETSDAAAKEFEALLKKYNVKQ